MKELRSPKKSSGKTKGVPAAEIPALTILDKQDVLNILHISDRTLYDYVNSGLLRCSKIRGKLYFFYQDLVEMLLRNR